VRAIAQTNDGAMWFGTEADSQGLTDAARKRSTIPTLPHGRVLALQTDPEGALWVGTESGAARFSGSDFERIKETRRMNSLAIVIADGVLTSHRAGQRVSSHARARAEASNTRALLNGR
jgi:hypothetical protein